MKTITCDPKKRFPSGILGAVALSTIAFGLAAKTSAQQPTSPDGEVTEKRNATNTEVPLKAVDQLKGKRFKLKLPEKATSISVWFKGHKHPMTVSPFSIFVTDDLHLKFEGGEKSIIVNYNHFFTTGTFNQNEHNWPQPCVMGKPSFERKQIAFADGRRIFDVKCRIPWVRDGAGKPGETHMTLRLSLDSLPTAKIQFNGSTKWHDLTVGS